ncbi:MAG: chloride channel protein [Halobacteriovoraceae bacterium]|nr:chloride channel protein [Halobacteriovoraceae bacterium]MBT5096080.1 chloride channel protein [Halobacteriovoraceae bacterium]
MKVPPIWKVSFLRKFIKNEVTEERTFFALTLLTGILAGLISVALYKATHYLTSYFGTDSAFTLRTLAFGGGALFISGYLTTRKFPSTAGSGIPGVRIALAVYHGKINIGATVAKFFTSILSLSSGLSLGREGPTVAITAGIGSSLGKAFSLSKKKVKALVAIGSAGGIAAAFNTPMAAIVFTLEEIVGDLNAKLLGSIIISSVVAAMTAAYFLGDKAALGQLNYSMASYRELYLFGLVGLAAAVLGPLWVKLVLKFRSMSQKIFKGHRLTVIMLTFLFIAGLSLYEPQILGSGHIPLQDTLLSLILDWKVLLVLFVLKFVVTALCYASGASGGLFMPTLLIGATLGGLVAALAKLGFPALTINMGAFALVGMGAFFASVIRAPFSSIIMVFELTRDYHLIAPLMLANITSYMISSRFLTGSIYEKISEQDGIHLPTREDGDVLELLHVEDAMIQNPISLNAKISITAAMKGLEGNDFSGYPVLKNGLLVGMVSTNDIGSTFAKGEGDETLLEDISEKKIISIYPDQSLLVAFHRLRKYHISRLPVVSRINDRRIVGIITAEDIVSKFGFHVTSEDDDENILEELETVELEN